MTHTVTKKKARDRFDDLSLRLDLTFDPLTQHWGIAAYASGPYGRFKTVWTSTGDGEPCQDHLKQALVIIAAKAARWRYVHSIHQAPLFPVEE